MCRTKSFSSYWCFLATPFLSYTSPPPIVPVSSILRLLYRGLCFSQIFASQVIYSVRFFICSMPIFLWWVLFIYCCFPYSYLPLFLGYLLEKIFCWLHYDHLPLHELRLISYTNDLRSRVSPEACINFVGIFPMLSHFHKWIALVFTFSQSMDIKSFKST